MSTKGISILEVRLRAINIGVTVFADSLKHQGVGVVHVEWRPPAGGDPDAILLLERLEAKSQEQSSQNC